MKGLFFLSIFSLFLFSCGAGKRIANKNCCNIKIDRYGSIDSDCAINSVTLKNEDIEVNVQYADYNFIKFKKQKKYMVLVNTPFCGTYTFTKFIKPSPKRYNPFFSNSKP